MTISIIFKNSKTLTLRNIDSLYLSLEDNIWRFFNDLHDYTIEEDLDTLEGLGLEFEDDTIFVPHNTIQQMSIR